MRQIFVLSIFFFLSLSGIGQSNLSLADTLTANRKLFTTEVIRQGITLNNSKISLLVQSSPKWSRKHLISRIILPAGPLVTIGGIYMGYDAIKGIPMVAVIDGTEYPYTVRSLPKLMAGIALFATGMSMVESANETRGNIVKWHNAQLKQKLGESSKSSVGYNIGIQNNGIGLSVKF